MGIYMTYYNPRFDGVFIILEMLWGEDGDIF